ncbi:hypothetical protein BCR36DRAFT_322475 [Piromyces finnis]|uniref:C2H2-type domain-containing protein n=1 Tax=Piromyces finnis TaxID=1754191 RepID=A0A1Y1VEE1_9FUNG|nr:hypothetical protein BCR36DRAFT_322475 [Piromyces finnis]|eukprot:ORX54187.1 hypothetical protein BCR36DRAFT_322475 [Piromyces finnis]
MEKDTSYLSSYPNTSPEKKGVKDFSIASLIGDERQTVKESKIAYDTNLSAFQKIVNYILCFNLENLKKIDSNIDKRIFFQSMVLDKSLNTNNLSILDKFCNVNNNPLLPFSDGVTTLKGKKIKNNLMKYIQNKNNNIRSRHKDENTNVPIQNTINSSNSNNNNNDNTIKTVCYNDTISNDNSNNSNNNNNNDNTINTVCYNDTISNDNNSNSNNNNSISTINNNNNENEIFSSNDNKVIHTKLKRNRPTKFSTENIKMPFKIDCYCFICNKVFNRKYDLRRHARLHTNLTPYKCKACGKKFCRSDYLKNHIRSHPLCCFSKHYRMNY